MKNKIIKTILYYIIYLIILYIFYNIAYYIYNLVGKPFNIFIAVITFILSIYLGVVGLSIIDKK